MSVWGWVAGSALSLASASSQGSGPQASLPPAAAATAPSPAVLAQIYGAAPSYPAPAVDPFTQWKNYLAGRARASGIRESTIRSVIPSLRLDGRVMALDQAQQPIAYDPSYQPTFGPYLQRHITADLIGRGRARFDTHRDNLARIQARYGVDPEIIIAIYGKETSYGRVTGNFDLLGALATLGYEGRRRSFFEEEFLAAMKLLDQGVPRWLLKGSYAGATGYPQFMPSVALRLRADGDGDGFADIWRDEDDAFASIANYLRDAGWKPGIPWGVPVSLPANFNRSAVRTRINPPRCPAVYRRHSRWLSVGEWRTMGVVPTGRGLADSEIATLMETPGAYAQAYLLTTNYRAILDYNCSNYYALTIGLLANAIARR